MKNSNFWPGADLPKTRKGISMEPSNFAEIPREKLLEYARMGGRSVKRRSAETSRANQLKGMRTRMAQVEALRERVNRQLLGYPPDEPPERIDMLLHAPTFKPPSGPIIKRKKRLWK